MSSDPLIQEENRAERLYKATQRALRDNEFHEYERAYWKFPKWLKDKGITLQDIIEHNVITDKDIEDYVKDLQYELTQDQYFKLDPPAMSHSELVEYGYDQ